MQAEAFRLHAGSLGRSSHVRLIEQNTASLRSRFENRRQQMAAAAADIRNRAIGGKIVRLENTSELSGSLAHHRFVEETRSFRVLAEVLPVAAGHHFLLCGF